MRRIILYILFIFAFLATSLITINIPVLTKAQMKGATVERDLLYEKWNSFLPAPKQGNTLYISEFFEGPMLENQQGLLKNND